MICSCKYVGTKKLTLEQIRFLARDVVEGDFSLPVDHHITRETRQAIGRVMVEMLNNIYKTYGLGEAKVKLVISISFFFLGEKL